MRCRKQYLHAVKYRKYSRVTFIEDTIIDSPKVLTAKFLGIDRLFCFINICKFGSPKNSFAAIIILSELYFRFKGFIMLIQTKKVISVS